MKTFSSFFILLMVLFWSINPLVLKADTGGEPPVVQIYSVSPWGPITDYVEVETGETFLLAAIAEGEVPLYYDWIYAYGRFSGPLAELTFDLPGEYPVVITVTDVNGHTALRLIRVVVGGGFPPPYVCNLDILVDGQSLDEATYDLVTTALLTTQGSGIEPIAYSWWVNGLPSSTNSSLNISVSTGAWYFVYLETIDAEGCRSYDVVKLKGAACVAPTPSVIDEDYNYVSSITIKAGDPLILHMFGDSNCRIVGYEKFWMIGDEVIDTGVLDGYIFTEPGVYTIYAVFRDWCGCVGRAPVEVTVLPLELPYGSICGRVFDVDAGLFAGVTVKLIDIDNNQVGDPIVTGADGSYAFVDLEIKPYTVMIVTPLGMTTTPAESIPGIEPGEPCCEVNFILMPTVVENDSRGLGYWKHQFDVYLTGKGNAQETATDLETYLDAVYVHFNLLGVYTGLGEFDFEDAKNVLTVRGGKLTLDRAKQHLFALLLNFASGRIGNATVISEDGRDAADAVTYVAQLIGDGDETNDKLAKNICEVINQGQMLEAGIVPESNIVYKLSLSRSGLLQNTFALYQNFPNPFNSTSVIKYSVPQSSNVVIKVFDILGNEIETLMNEEKPAGSYEVKFNAIGLPSGLYFYRLQAGSFIETKKMVLMK